MHTSVETEELGAAAEAILAATNEGMWGLDEEGRTFFLSPAAERMLGWRSAELRGRDTHPLLHHSRADGSPYSTAECPVHRTRRDGRPRHVDTDVFWHRDGRPVPVRYRVAPIRGSGRPGGVVVAFSERRRPGEGAERGARGERLLAHAARCARLGVWEWEPASGRAWFSDELVRLTGRRPGELEPRIDELVDCIHPGERARLRAALERAWRRGEGFRLTATVPLADNGWRALSLCGGPLQDPHARTMRIAGTASDESEQRRLELHLAEERQRSKRLELAGVPAGGMHESAPSAAGVPRRLTRREQEVLELIAGGLTSEQIASSLGVSKQTVRTHARNMMEKLGARTRAQAVAIALRGGEG